MGIARIGLLALVTILTSQPLSSWAQRPEITSELRPFVLDEAKVFALVNARLIDGTGEAVRDRQTIILRDGRIEAVGDSDTLGVPEDAKRLDMSGKTVLPGLVQVHEHLWMYAGSPLGVQVSYPRLYLSAGVTSIRTAGSYNPYADLRAKRDIESGLAAGPWMDLTVYTSGLATPPLESHSDIERYLGFWLDSGFDSVKVYSSATPEMARWIVDYAHSRDVKVTGHICNLSYAQAVEIGMDAIEHGFAFLPDVVPEIVNGTAQGRPCPMAALKAMDHVDMDSPELAVLIERLVDAGLVVTSTLPALEDITAEGGPGDGHDLLVDYVRDYNRDYRARITSGEVTMRFTKASLRKSIELERRFMRAGGLLAVGTDSAVPSGGVVAGFSAARQLELMVLNGFAPLEAIRASTLNGALALDRADLVGTIEPGKQADLLVVDGDPSVDISDIRNATVVFKQGIAYDPKALRESVRGKVGIF